MTTRTTTPRALLDSAISSPAESPAAPKKPRRKPGKRYSGTSGHWEGDTFICGLTAHEEARLHEGESPADVLKRAKARAEREHLELTFLQWARGMYALGLLPMPHPQWRFEPGRDWAYDYCYVGVNGKTLAIDLDGGIAGRRNPKTGEWEKNARSGHTSISGYENDREKDAHAIMAGIYPLRLTAKMLKNGTGYTYVERALGVRRRGRKGAA